MGSEMTEAYEQKRGPGGRSNSSQAHQTNATAATLSAVEIHVSLVGRKDLTGEIYRQLRRPVATRLPLLMRLRPETTRIGQRLRVFRWSQRGDPLIRCAWSVCAGAVRWMVGNGLWLVVRRLPNRRRPPRGRILRPPYVTA